MPRRLLPLIVPLLLLGCAGTVRLDRPADFPNHASDHPFFDLHWRLERTADRVEAVGLVEAARVDGIYDVTVELRGLDDAGRVVSRGLGRTYGGRLPRWHSQPFAVGLRPTGREARFELEVWSFTWEGTMDRNGRGREN